MQRGRTGCGNGNRERGKGWWRDQNWGEEIEQEELEELKVWETWSTWE
jgi:hypothetical protein